MASLSTAPERTGANVERVLLVRRRGMVRLMSPQQDVRGGECGAEVGLVEPPSAGEVAEDGGVGETMM
jgi:hypothetical protein